MKRAPRLKPRRPSLRINRSELDGHARIQGRLRAGPGAHARSAAAGNGAADRVVVVEAELVLPVAIGHPDIDHVALLLTKHRLRRVEGQADRLRVELDLGRIDTV